MHALQPVSPSKTLEPARIGMALPRPELKNNLLEQEYVVPILVKALTILDTLQTSPIGLHLDELSRKTGVARSTAYRIVRTLVLSEHLVHCRNGAYRARREQGSSSHAR